MPPRPGPRDCDNCGDRYRGAGRLCPDCVPLKDPAPAGRTICRACSASVTWDTLKRKSRFLEGAWVECMYYCGGCGGVLEFAAWAQLAE